MKQKSIPLVLTLALMLGGRAPAAQVPSMPEGWREAPEYVELFAPVYHRERYRAFVAARTLDAIVREAIDDRAFLRPPGAWTPESLAPRDAFGESGPYNRSRLVMLYGGHAVRIARGPHVGAIEGVESWTLLSPYPDPSFRRLEQGTLLLIAAMP